jgi:O-antigen/teichoic acid export membrane protein
MLDLGLGAALITLVAQGVAARNISLARDQVAAGLLGTTVMAGVVFVGGGAGVWLCSGGAARAVFLVAVGSIALTIPLSLANTVWLGLQKGYVAGGWNIAQTILNLSGLLLAVFLGAGPLVMVVAFYGSTLLAGALSLAHLMVAHPELRPQRWLLPGAVWRQVLSKSLLFAAIAMTAGLGYSLDNVLALALLGPAASAQMAVLLRVGVNATGLVTAITQPLWPAFTDAHARAERKWVRLALLGGTAAVVLLGLAGGAVLVVYGQGFLLWWLHDDLGVGRPLLWAAAVWIFVLALLLNALADLKFLLAVSAASAALALVLKFLLAADFGVAGILLAAPAASLLIIWPAYAWRLRGWWSGNAVT